MRHSELVQRRGRAALQRRVTHPDLQGLQPPSRPPTHQNSRQTLETSRFNTQRYQRFVQRADHFQ